MRVAADSFGRIGQYLQYRTVFKSHRDVTAYRAVRDHPERFTEAVPLTLRAVPARPLWCRPNTMDPITLWDAFFRGYHLPTFPLPHARTILDLGANAGYTAASFAAEYPNATIVAVEMDADNASLCERNVEQFGSRCRVLHAAIWSTSGPILYGGNNVHDYSIGSGGHSTRTTEATTIEDLLDRLELTQVDYLKMDIEGAEASVLRSPIRWASRVRSLSVEVHPPATMEQCRHDLIENGFDCRVHPQHPSSLVARRNGS
jgi:FkbM family methyltransferase